ncbi:protein of unknown function [Bradyrhizobium vignae]|uniref:Uncharacterized protein n=1 Tax=Bradyrhizobium vignae TaxID=1549949 RepID=A0A2U3Q918_9BRAD|nr:protein of unknown function [Bradyrhizobium vignae]
MATVGRQNTFRPAVIELIGYCCGREITLPGDAPLRIAVRRDSSEADRSPVPKKKSRRRTIWLTEAPLPTLGWNLYCGAVAAPVCPSGVPFYIDGIQIAAMDQGDSAAYERYTLIYVVPVRLACDFGFEVRNSRDLRAKWKKHLCLL